MGEYIKPRQTYVNTDDFVTIWKWTEEKNTRFVMLEKTNCEGRMEMEFEGGETMVDDYEFKFLPVIPEEYVKLTIRIPIHDKRGLKRFEKIMDAGWEYI